LSRPVHRSKTRILTGMLYYRFKRYINWYLGNKRWAATFKRKPYKYLAFKHKTPLIRKLRNVDMWMQYNKILNLKIAVSRLNGIVVYPGEYFSFWKLIGKPTRRKGYVQGMVLSNGQIKADVGGGLCQLSNLIYWMTLHTPLTFTERYRHTYDVFPDSNRKLPFGSGATCAYNYIDLQVYNDTNQAYQLILYLTED